MTTPCGCQSSPSSDKPYLLVEATSSTIDACGSNPQGQSPGNCDKSEPMFDESLSDFLIPSKDSSVNMSVCNGAIYSVGMWIEFLNPIAKLQITSISGNILTLVNRNINGDEVAENPDIGTQISVGTRFVVGSSSHNISDADRLEQIESALDGATEIEVSNLGASSSTAVVHPIGRVESDPSNLSAKKAIKRIFGILFNAGRPVLNALGTTVPIEDMADYRPLVKHKTSHIVRQARSLSENGGLASNRQYVLSVTNSGEKLLQTYLSKIARRQLDIIGDVHSPLSWPVTVGDYETEYDLSSWADMQPPDGNVLDHYYVMCSMELAGNKDAGTARIMRAELNGVTMCRVGIHPDPSLYYFNNSTRLVRIETSGPNAYKLKLKLFIVNDARYWYRLNIDEIRY